jgi:hypothetical protein
VPSNRDSDQQLINQIAQILELRNKIIEVQKKKSNLGKTHFTNQYTSGELLNEIPLANIPKTQNNTKRN